MKKDDNSISSFLKNLFGKNEPGKTTTPEDDFDADYYRGDYKIPKKSPTKTSEDASYDVNSDDRSDKLNGTSNTRSTPKTENYNSDVSSEAPVYNDFESKADLGTEDFDFIDFDDENIDDIAGDSKMTGAVTMPQSKQGNAISDIDEENENLSIDSDGDDSELADVSFVEKATLADATKIADLIVDGAITVIDVTETVKEEKMRMFDFISGVVYATGGKMEKYYGGRYVVVLPDGISFDDFEDIINSMK